MAGTITHKWSGTTLIITSDSGTSSCDLKGAQGDMGIRGAQGVKGDVGAQGIQGVKGDKGDPFTYDDFTPEQLAALKGEQGDAGAKGDKGDKGDQGEKGDTGVQGYTPVKGTDYWTAADIAEIKSYVDTAILNGAW